jgi:hypothetical protein
MESYIMLFLLSQPYIFVGNQELHAKIIHCLILKTNCSNNTYFTIYWSNTLF